MDKATFSWKYTVESVKRVKAPNSLRPKFRVLSPLLGDHNRGQIIHMARREKTFKNPSYRVYKRILERYMRVKMGYETSIP
jgi:hypothetical protein